MKEIISGNPNSKILVLDEPGQGNACHEYEVRRVASPDATLEQGDYFAKVSFQNGPVKEFGVNGCHQEDLLEIIVDRLGSFQSGNFACRENALALTKCEEALMWLKHRTIGRVKRGVEGKNVI